MSIQTVEISTPDSFAVVEIRQGPAGEGGGGSNSITSATTSDGTANLSLANVTTATAEVTGTFTANHIHGNLAGNVYAHVRAGEELAKGDPVYVSGSHGSGSTLIAIVSKADASNAAKMPAVGIMDAAVANNDNGHMVITGIITELATNAYSINAELYVAAGGGMTATPPTALAQPVARVERSNLNNGAILVKVNGLSASDATGNTLVRRTSGGGASFTNPTFGDGFQITEAGGTDTFGMRSATADTWSMYGPDYGDVMSFSKAGIINFSPSNFTYGTGAAAAHRTALGAGATGSALFTAATPAAARTTLELGSTNTPTFGGLDLLTAGTTTLNVYNSLSGANFERMSFRWASNIARIGTAKGGTGTARDLTLETDGTERVRVLSTGSVGIGTTAPTAALHVVKGATPTLTSIFANPAGDVFNQFAAQSGTGEYGVWQDALYFQALASLGNGIRFFIGSTNALQIAAPSGNVGIGTSTPSALLDVNSDTVRVRTARTPASATAAGNAGDICWDANYIYVCTATNTWKRTAISTWP